MSEGICLRNFVKAKAFYFLSVRSFRQYDMSPLREIANSCQVNVNSLAVLLGRWVKWEYLVRQQFISSDEDKRVYWYYRLTSHGVRYLTGMERWYGQLDIAKKQVIDHVRLSHSYVYYDGKRYHVFEAPEPGVSDKFRYLCEEFRPSAGCLGTKLEGVMALFQQKTNCSADILEFFRDNVKKNS